MRKAALLSSSAAIAWEVGECLAASPAQYSIREIPQMAHAVGVNRNGVVVGEGSHTFLVYVVCSAVSDDMSRCFSASDINDRGQIIGDLLIAQSSTVAAILYLSGGQKLLPPYYLLFLTLGPALS